jgi:hypothetical protein
MTPGSKPFEAALRKQSRHIANFLKNALGLPQIGHRLYFRLENFGLSKALAFNVFLDTINLLFSKWHSKCRQ